MNSSRLNFCTCCISKTYSLFTVIIGLILFSGDLKSQEITTKCLGKESVDVIYPALTAREGLGLKIPTPQNEHPRLFFRKRDIPDLQKKTTSPLLEPTWKKLLQYANSPSDGKLIQNGAKANINTEVINAIDAKAFLYAYSKDLAKGKQAVNAIFNFDSTLIFETQNGDYCREMGRVILSNALVYDWCYDLLTPEQKKILINKMETLATMMEIKWPRLVQGSITGHGTEAQVSREMLACGIAVYNEKPEIYNLAAGRIFAEFLPSRNFFQSAGYHHQGSAYGPYRYLWDMYITMIYDKMGYPEIFGKDQALVPYKWIYTRRPDGQLLRDGDDFAECKTEFGKYWPVKCNAYTGSSQITSTLMQEIFKSIIKAP
jgi:heparin/heparan-sulfate lyase